MRVCKRSVLKDSIRHFVPAWHTLVMGTGGLTACISRFPFGDEKTRTIATVAAFILTLFLFTVITSATVCRYILFPDLWSRMIRHPTQSLYISAFAMGGATTISGAVAASKSLGLYSTSFAYSLWALWLLDVAISVVTLFGMVYAMICLQEHSLERMTPAWFLPIVTLVVASSTGAIVAEGLPQQYALITICVSFSILVIGLSFVVLLLAIWLLRLVVHGPPSTEMILSVFIVLGPLGQGGFSFVLNGTLIKDLYPSSQPLSGQTLFTICICAAWVLWSMGIAWILIALMIISSGGKRRIPFSLGYWGMVFPNATWALCSVELGNALGASFFSYIGSVWCVIVFALWSLAFVNTVPATWDRSLFRAPCIQEKMREETHEFQDALELEGRRQDVESQ